MKIDEIFFTIILACTLILAGLCVIAWQNPFMGFVFLTCAVIAYKARKQCD